MRQSVTEAGGALTRECGTMPCPALDPHGEGPQEAELVAHQRSWPPTTPMALNSHPEVPYAPYVCSLHWGPPR